MDRLPLYKFPYTDYHDLNLSWVIEQINNMYQIIDTKIHEVTDPIVTDLDATKVRVTNLETNLSALNEQVTINSNRITNITSQLQGIGQTIGTILGDINTINTDITTINSDINTISGTVNTHTEEIADIYNIIAGIDPDSGLIINAENFDTEEKTVSILDPVYKFELKGGINGYTYVLYPDLIPGTQSGYYNRVTMLEDSTTHKIKLPSELTTGTLPSIIRGTYATNVNVDAEIYSGTPLEHTINGDSFVIEGEDEEAIILICAACLHRGVNEYENIFTNNGENVIMPIPFVSTDIINPNRYTGVVIRPNDQQVIRGITPYVYFFDIEGNLLNHTELTREDVNIPAGTYSIWYGVYAHDFHERFFNTDMKIVMFDGGAGLYYVSSDQFITYHRVEFEYNDTYSGGFTVIGATKVGKIRPLYNTDTIDMLTGDMYRNNYKIDSFHISGHLYSLVPDKKYNVTLIAKTSGYTDADIKYNKIMVLLDSLNGNNISY